ncbi:MAG: hypothetical protein PUA56_03275 [Bacillales bacterium]|nr:hypothetical protein [Bacillales bacterium]
MTKVMKTLTSTCLLAVCALSLVSCGSTKLTNAKKYMKDHASDFANWSIGTLTYKDDNLKVNVVSGKGSYSKDDVSATFTVSYDWKADSSECKFEKYTAKGSNVALDLVIKGQVVALYVVVEGAAAAYAAEQSK